MRSHILHVVVVAVAFLLVPLRAEAFIERLYTLREIMDESKVILEGKITKVDAKAKAAIITVGSTLKGKTAFKQINANIRVGQVWHPDVLMQRLKVGQPVLVFYDLQGEAISCLVHTDGIFFQLFAEQRGDLDRVWWQFTHIELKLRRTYDGSTEALTELVKQVLAGRAQTPPPSDKGASWTREELLGGGLAQSAAAGGGSGAVFSQWITLAGSAQTRGVAWGDYDADGDWDALLCAPDGVRLHRYSTSQKRFVEETKNLGLSGGARCGWWADYDGDGKVDLTLIPANARPALWRNEGTRFANVSQMLPDAGHWNGEGAGGFDANGDGRPDILMSNGEHGNLLLVNRGQGPKWFDDASSAWGLGPKGLGVGNGDYLALADYDCDGWVDFLYNASGGVLAHNEEGERFAAVGGAGIRYVTDNQAKLGAAFGDFDNDGDMDLFVPQRQGCRLYRNNADGSFSDITAASSDLATLRNAQTSAWGDVNRDGLLDLVVGCSDQPLRLFLNDGQSRFMEPGEETLAAGVQKPTRGAAGLAFADYDGDGDLDLLLAGDGGTGVLVNTSIAKPGRAMLRVRVPAEAALGAIVRVYDGKDRLVGLRQLGLVQNFSSQEPPEALFAVPAGAYKLAILLSDGRVEQASITVPPTGLLWAMKRK